MYLILLYGPPASGKLTVAKELQGLTDYTLIDNHRATDYLLELLPREESKYEKSRAVLGRKIRLLLFEAAAENDINLITTFAPLAEGAHDYIRSIKQIIETSNASLCLVQLLPTRQALEERVENQNRQGGKLKTSRGLNQLIEKYPVMFETFPDIDHLVIDNSKLAPNEVAQQICDYYHIGTLTP